MTHKTPDPIEALKDNVEKIVEPFLKRWTGNSFPHLVDTDENDGERLRQAWRDSLDQAHAAGVQAGREKERERCAGVVEQIKNADNINWGYTQWYNAIRNAIAAIRGEGREE